MFANDRTELRKIFTESWRRFLQDLPLEPLEAMVAEVIRQHPEYHPLLQDPDTAVAREFLPAAGEENPFLHMGMHISLQEQIATDRPPGITALYQQLVRNSGDPHEAEHRMMECLGPLLWEAHRHGRMPDDESYLECLGKQLR